MASLIKKTQTLVSANLHALVDKALKNNSVKVLDQYIREAQGNLRKLENTLINVITQLKSMQRKERNLVAETEKLDGQIDALLRQGRDRLALAIQSKYNDKLNLIDQYQVQIEHQKLEVESLQAAKIKLESRLDTIKSQRENLIILLELAKSKEIAIKTVRSLDDLQGIGDNDIARIADSIHARLDRAEVEMETYSGRLDNQLDETIERTMLEDQLATRRKRLTTHEQKLLEDIET
ncbi:MAG: hypothetical protein B6242_13190 [Anaerolineaceae bacterium 4572_78]|nr:MAG: hypothetical protein B6242_13190 [Anaerolineaceae bacterium 4572_78]